MKATHRPQSPPAPSPWPQPPARQDDIAGIVRQLRAHLRESEHAAQPQQQEQFRRKMDALLDQLERRLAAIAHGPGDDRTDLLRRQREQAISVWQSIEYVSGQMREFTGDRNAPVLQSFRMLRTTAQRAQRKISLQIANDPDEIEATLRWMAGMGDEDDLFLLRAVMRTAPYTQKETASLAARAEKEIVQNVYDPEEVAKRGEAAYLRHQEEWDSHYAGETIAIVRDAVVAHHRDPGKVAHQLLALQREHGLFRAYLVEIGARVFECGHVQGVNFKAAG